MGQEDEKRRELNDRLWWFEYAKNPDKYGIKLEYKVIIDSEFSELIKRQRIYSVLSFLAGAFIMYFFKLIS